jgi:hypothetical protein
MADLFEIRKEILVISADIRYQALIQNTLKNKPESQANPR